MLRKFTKMQCLYKYLNKSFQRRRKEKRKQSKNRNKNKNKNKDLNDN